MWRFPMLVEIFKKDLVDGEQDNCETCAVARALCRLPFPDGANTVKVDHKEIEYTYKRPGQYYGAIIKRVKTPRAVENYIRRFDKDKNSVCPTVFNIDL
jgi:hypothetical protein